MSLRDVLRQIDWIKNVKDSLSFEDTESRMAVAARRLAIWANQLELADTNNPALSFIREMHVAMRSSELLISLCVYKSSAASARTLVENCLYYSYFNTHLSELATIVRDSKYYMSKSEIIDYHKKHTPAFKQRQECLNLLTRLDTWYSAVSAIIHGQVPGDWNTNSTLSETKFFQPTHNLALTTLLEGEKLANDWLLVVITGRFWNSFAPDAKSFLLQGVSAHVRTTLELDNK